MILHSLSIIMIRFSPIYIVGRILWKIVYVSICLHRLWWLLSYLSFTRINSCLKFFTLQIYDSSVNTELIWKVSVRKNCLDDLCIRIEMNRLSFTPSAVQLISTQCTGRIEYEMIAWTKNFFTMSATTLIDLSFRINSVSDILFYFQTRFEKGQRTKTKLFAYALYIIELFKYISSLYLFSQKIWENIVIELILSRNLLVYSSILSSFLIFFGGSVVRFVLVIFSTRSSLIVYRVLPILGWSRLPTFVIRYLTTDIDAFFYLLHII